MGDRSGNRGWWYPLRHRKMIAFKKEALDILHSFPESPYRKGLEDMVLFVTDRKY